jgi:hypothetical protein
LDSVTGLFGQLKFNLDLKLLVQNFFWHLSKSQWHFQAWVWTCADHHYLTILSESIIIFPIMCMCCNCQGYCCCCNCVPPERLCLFSSWALTEATGRAIWGVATSAGSGWVTEDCAGQGIAETQWPTSAFSSPGWQYSYSLTHFPTWSLFPSAARIPEPKKSFLLDLSPSKARSDPGRHVPNIPALH